MLDYMTRNLDVFETSDGKLPAPFSIVLCQRDLPQLDAILDRIEGVEYGPRSRFHMINFNDVDLDAIADAPILQVAISLYVFANRVDKENMDDELLAIF